METTNSEQLRQNSPDLMPNSLTDENYVISLMYYSVERAESILLRTDAEDFFNGLNRKVFRIASALTDAGIMITSHTIVAELLREYEGRTEEIPFDAPTVYELQSRYQAEYQIADKDGLEGAIKHLKADRTYRDIIYRAKDAVLMAQSREGTPENILAPLEEFSNELAKAKGNIIVWMDEAEKKAQETYDKLDRGEIVTIPTGFPEVDNILYGGGTWGGDLVLVSGVTSGGKTTFSLNMADNAADLGIKSLYFSLEMKTFKLFSRLHSAKSKIPAYKIAPLMTNKYGEGVRDKLRSTGWEMSKKPIGLVDTVRDMETAFRVSKFAVREFGVQQIFIDYLGLMTPSKRFKGSRYERASVVSENCKELASFLDVPVVGLVQLRRKDKTEKNANDKEGNDAEPTLDMLKDSGQYENDADTVLFLWGEKGKEGETQGLRDIKGRIAKQRQGKLDRFSLKFAPDIFTFSSMEKLARIRASMGETEF